ncbi:MAG: hypothetical protein EZS28_027588, partial [Streblomastix strix]
AEKISNSSKLRVSLEKLKNETEIKNMYFHYQKNKMKKMMMFMVIT